MFFNFIQKPNINNFPIKEKILALMKGINMPYWDSRFGVKLSGNNLVSWTDQIYGIQLLPHGSVTFSHSRGDQYPELVFNSGSYLTASLPSNIQTLLGSSPGMIFTGSGPLNDGSILSLSDGSINNTNLLLASQGIKSWNSPASLPSWIFASGSTAYYADLQTAQFVYLDVTFIASSTNTVACDILCDNSGGSIGFGTNGKIISIVNSETINGVNTYTWSPGNTVRIIIDDNGPMSQWKLTVYVNGIQVGTETITHSSAFTYSQHHFFVLSGNNTAYVPTTGATNITVGRPNSVYIMCAQSGFNQFNPNNITDIIPAQIWGTTYYTPSQRKTFVLFNNAPVSGSTLEWVMSAPWFGLGNYLYNFHGANGGIYNLANSSALSVGANIDGSSPSSGSISQILLCNVQTNKNQFNALFYSNLVQQPPFFPVY